MIGIQVNDDIKAHRSVPQQRRNKLRGKCTFVSDDRTWVELENIHGEHIRTRMIDVTNDAAANRNDDNTPPRKVWKPDD